jgi:nickel-dependent lactate racemase
MNIKLDFGKKGLSVSLPDRNIREVLELLDEPGLLNPQAELVKKLEGSKNSRSFEELCKGRRHACIVVSDRTRPVPNHILLPPLLGVLDRQDIRTTILIACGMHSPTEGDDLKALLGREIYENCEIVNHRGGDELEIVFAGKSRKGVDIHINRHYMEAVLRILTGFVEPHFMAGFSGGRKAVCPGICGTETMKFVHSAEMMAHERSAPGVIDGNPFHEFALETAKIAGVDFIVNVTLNRAKEITGIFTGDLEAAHSEGMEYCRKNASVSFASESDIVITTNSGFPLDQDLYQSVKGMVSALPVVKKGGTIIIAAECAKGIGSGNFRRMLFEMKDAASFNANIRRPGFFCIDQWEVQELLKVFAKAKVKLVCSGIEAADVRKCGIMPAGSVEQAVSECLAEYGENASITVIPSGPLILPVL